MTKPRAIQPVSSDEALVVFGVVFLAFHLGGGALSNIWGDHASTPLHWLIVAGFPIAHLLKRRLPLAQTLRLRPPSPRHWAGAFVFAFGIIGAGALYMLLQNSLFGVSEAYEASLEQWSERLSSSTRAELALLFFTIVITPSICEEILFRGHLLRLLRPTMPRAPLCVLTGVLFGFFHLNFVQIIPAALIGIAFAWVALVTDSIWPAVLMHLIFNTVTILNHHFESALSDSQGVLLGIAGTLAFVCLPLGFHLLRPPRSETSTGSPPTATPSTESVTGVNP